MRTQYFKWLHFPKWGIGHLLGLLFLFPTLDASSQEDSTYIKTNAARIANPEQLSDSVYTLLSPYRLIMFGEMHGTNERLRL